MHLTPNPEFQMCVWKRISSIPSLRDMRPLLVQQDTISMASEGVSSQARSCVEDMTTRWLGLHPPPTAVRVQ